MAATTETQQGRNQRKIGNYLIDRRFQLKYSMLAVIASLLIAGVLGFFLYQARREASTLLKDQLITLQPSAELSGLINKTLEEDRDKTFWVLLASMGGFVVVLTAFGIFYTHRVAGPLYAIGRYIQQVSDGNLRDVRPLRKNDELKDFFELFNTMLKELQQREQRDLSVLDDVLKNADGLAPAQAEKLKDLRQRKQQLLG